MMAAFSTDQVYIGVAGSPAMLQAFMPTACPEGTWGNLDAMPSAGWPVWCDPAVVAHSISGDDLSGAAFAVEAPEEAEAEAEEGAAEGRNKRTRRSRRRNRKQHSTTMADGDGSGAAVQASNTASAVADVFNGEEFPPLPSASAPVRRLDSARMPAPACFFEDASMEPRALAENPKVCDEVVARLEPPPGGVQCPAAEAEALLEWILEDAPFLSMQKSTCRVVQGLLKVVGGPGRDQLARKLAPHTVGLYECPNGNHVLTKVIEVMPSASLTPIIEQVVQKGYLAVARHRFGCRALERLIEHCTEKEMSSLNNKFVESAEELCRHQYGNFVIQHLIEHGERHRSDAIVQRLLPTIPQLAMHRTASHVVQKALTYASDNGQREIVSGLFHAQAPNSFLEVAASRYGSYVTEELLNLRCVGSANLVEEARRRLSCAGAEHWQSAFFLRVAERYTIAPPSSSSSALAEAASPTS